MARYLSIINPSREWLAGFMKDPQDREAVLRPVFEAVGVTLHAIYWDPVSGTGYLITEGDDPGAADAITYATLAGGQTEAGTGRTIRVLTSSEFADVAGRAGGSGYTPPGS